MSVTLNPDNPFVGRGSEIASLVARLDDAIAGRGGVALLVGEPGIGKTRLARAFTVEAEARDALGVWGRCFEGEWSPPLTPWIEVIGGFARSSSSDRSSTRSQASMKPVEQIRCR